MSENPKTSTILLPSELTIALEKRMKELGIEQYRLGKALGITQGAVSHVFRGRTPMSLRFEKTAFRLIDEAIQEHEALEERRKELISNTN